MKSIQDFVILLALLLSLASVALNIAYLVRQRRYEREDRRRERELDEMAVLDAEKASKPFDIP